MNRPVPNSDIGNVYRKIQTKIYYKLKISNFLTITREMSQIINFYENYVTEF